MAEQLRDVVVVLPGIMGSVLRDAHGDDVWKLSAGSILKGLLGRGKAIKRLQLPDGIGDDHPGDGVTATALMPDMHVVPGIWTVTVGYERLLAWFRESFDVVEADPRDPDRVVNFVQFPYDWRLSNRYNARAAADGRAGARTVPKPAGKCRCPARVHQSLDGWARHELLRRRARRPRGDRQGHHTRHAAPRCAERTRLARERRAQGHRSDQLRPHRPRPQPARAVPAAPRVRVHRRRRRCRRRPRRRCRS